MNIEDFLPKYPNIHQSKYEELNSYDNFYKSIFTKKEFYENKLDGKEKFPKQKGEYTKYQKTIINYLSSNTPYDKILIIHDPGLGKTCSVIGSIEKIKSETDIYNKAIIFAKGETLLENFKKELVYSCTDGRYYPDNYKDLTKMEIIRRVNKKTKFYDFRTFAKFAKKLKNTRDQIIIDNYSNKIIVIDEVHNLRIHNEQHDTVEIYEQFHRFLHLVKNCKIFLLSGTPFKDTINEVPSIANLLLDMNEQFPTGNEFKELYTEKKGNIYYIKEEKKQEIKNKLKGKISFLKENQSPDIEKRFIGQDEKFGDLNHLVVHPVLMSEFQSRYYFDALENDSSGNKGIFNSSKEASLFVFPDGSYGSAGFSKYIKKDDKKKYKLREDLKNELKGKNNKETLKNIQKYSSIYHSCINNILKTDGNCFVYSSVVNGSGAILFSLLLELFGFEKSKGSEKDEGLRYALLTNETGGKESFSSINKTFNSEENVDGKLIKVIIGSKVVSEGYSFFNVMFECILTPHWNYSEIAQALARGIRMGSHSKYIKKYNRTPVVTISQPVSIPVETDKKFKIGNFNSLDLYMYKISEDKDITIRGILRLLMESAFDCGLNYIRNRTINSLDGSRECDYTTCDYKCDNLDMKYIKEKLDDSELDYSTYFLYYSNPKISEIRKKIESLFRENPKIENSQLQNILLKNFNQEEIDIALELLKRVSEKEDEKIIFNYKDFLNIYSNSNVKKIMNEIEFLYKENFLLDVNFIFKKFSMFQKFEVLTALRNLINNNVKIINKYGLPSYLREQKNIFFLVDSLTINSDFYINYYTKNIHIKSEKNFKNIVENVSAGILPKIIEIITTTKNETQLKKLLKDLPLELQQIFIEACITSKEMNIKKADKNRDIILYFYESYIKKIKNKWVSLFLQDEKNIVRCKDFDADYFSWQNCDKNIMKDIDIEEKLKIEKLRKKTKHNIIGKLNPQNDSFCIVDLEKEKNENDDRRLNYSGKVCSAGGWKINELIDIAVRRLKIDCPSNFRNNDSIEELIKDIKEDSYISEYLNILGDKEKNDKNYLRLILYWGTKKNKNNEKGGIRSIEGLCSGIKNYLEKNGLVEIDNLCGTQGKKIIKNEEKKINYFSATRFVKEIKCTKINIEKALNNYFEKDEIEKQVKNIQTAQNNEVPTLYIVNRKKNFVGFIKFYRDDLEELEYIAFLNKFTNGKDNLKDMIKHCFKDIYFDKSKNIKVRLTKLHSKYQTNINLYKNFGFKILRDTEQYTTMNYDYEPE
jgi:superfamily II DNA or RNA helicase